MVEFFNPPALWQPFGAFSMGAILGTGHIVHLKGQVALDAGGEPVGTADMAVQLRAVLENIRIALNHVGGTMADIVSLTQHVTDIEAFMAAGAVREDFFAPPYPVTTTVEVSRLFRPELMVEVTAMAEIPAERFRQPS